MSVIKPEEAQINRDVVTEIQIAALHDLLPNALLNNYFGPYYSKKLRRKREELHPAGQKDIRSIKTATGLEFSLNIGDRLGCDLFYGVFNEQADYELFMAMVTPGDFVVDVGANIGVYALVSALRVGDKGRVYAFEPDSRSYRLLEENTMHNGLRDRLVLNQYCLGEYDGTVCFNEASEPCLSGIIDTARSYVETSSDIQIRRLDTVMVESGCQQINVLKIDVEGAEAAVIHGASKILERSDALVMLEISTKNLDDKRTHELNEALRYLERMDYQAFRISLIKNRLVSYDNVDQIFQGDNGVVNGNYFMARRASGKANRLRAVFKRISHLMGVPHRFVRSRLVNDDSKAYLETQLWAEREKNKIALNLIQLLMSDGRK